MDALVQCEDFGGWTRLTLNRPEKLNVVTVEMFAELRRHVVDLKRADGVGMVAFSGKRG
ncbi:MAG TPA: hypothetical protein VGG53_03725 [Mycobacterium sp.]|jgi:enoyl-CoA hydratase/carnithine racemase|uniref:hypothetical protein n=1 Tax=Mycobacterium sp. TaxID=1785 RepID=UPI002F427833